MQSRRCAGVAITAFVLASTTLLNGQEAAATVQVIGAVKQPLTLTAQDLAKMPRTTARTTSNGVETVYEGVLINEVLKQAGVPQGSALRGKALAGYVLATAQDGSVASAKIIPGESVSSLRLSSPGQTENVFNEHGLAGDVVLCYPPHLSLANHIHCFDPLKRSPRRMEGPETLTRSDPPLHEAIVLLDDVVQVPYRSATTASTQFARPFQL
jgi:hypothetical protein